MVLRADTAGPRAVTGMAPPGHHKRILIQKNERPSLSTILGSEDGSRRQPEDVMEDVDPTSLVDETAASEASTRLGIRRFLQRQQPPSRQSRLLMTHSRRHMLLRPAEDTSWVRAPCAWS